MPRLRSMIPCAHCGVRPIEEFLYGEVPAPPASLVDADARDLDRGFMHDNAEGLVAERWFHAFGCRRWVSIRRDTRSDEIV
jgi:heterotetrameric sarcosine oxidase delta subunit